MKTYHINIKGYCKGTKENDYIENCISFGTAINRACQKFRKDFKGVKFDEILIKVVM